jgi:hypothetical protein
LLHRPVRSIALLESIYRHTDGSTEDRPDQRLKIACARHRVSGAGPVIPSRSEKIFVGGVQKENRMLGTLLPGSFHYSRQSVLVSIFGQTWIEGYK